MTDIPVNLGSRAYRILVAVGALGTVGAELAKLRVGRKAVLITDPAIDRLHGEPVARSLTGAGFDLIRLAVPEGQWLGERELAGRVRCLDCLDHRAS